MQAIVLIILYQGQETLAVYDTDSAAWDALLEFVDQRWQGRFGHIPRPDYNDDRVETFFSGEHVYLLASSAVIGLDPWQYTRAVYYTDFAACDALRVYVDRRGPGGFVHNAGPDNNYVRIDPFIGGEGFYLLASPAVIGLEPTHRGPRHSASSSAR